MSDAWGQLTWSIGNFGAQNDSTVDVTGASLSLATGSVTLESGYILSGEELSFATGEIGLDIGVTVEPDSFSLSSNLGNLDADPDANLTGQSITIATGDVVVEDDIQSGWGRQSWNANAWGIQGTLIPNSVSATIALNDIAEITGDALVIPDSLQITATTGNLGAVGIAEVTVDSLSATIATGQLDIEPDANPVGIEMSANLGTVAAYNLEGWGRYFWGEFEWGATGLWETADLTGIQLTATIDNIGEITGDGNIDVTGQEATIAEGNLDADPDANITGIELTIATGDLTDIIADANVTPDSIALSIALGDEEAIPNTIASSIGLSLTMALDSVDNTGDANVSVTGIALIASVGTVFPLIWNEVQTDSDAIWTEVDTAA